MKRDREADSLPYRAYTRQFDREIGGDQIPELLGVSGKQLLYAYVSGLDPVIARWKASAETALIEADHKYADVEFRSSPDTVACLLLDHSGSMSGQRAILAIALTEIVADYWSRIGWRFEILGFTTTTWRGGRSRKKWSRRADGQILGGSVIYFTSFIKKPTTRHAVRPGRSAT